MIECLALVARHLKNKLHFGAMGSMMAFFT